MKNLLINKVLSTCFLLSVCSGCATLSKEECVAANWEAISFEDGSRGRAASYLTQHRKACAEYGIGPEVAPYQMGREKGLRHYCQGGNGLTGGLRGVDYLNVCPRDLEPAFLAAYEEGRRIYLIEREVSSLHSQVQRLLRDLEQVREELDVAESKDEIRDLAREEGALEKEIEELEYHRIRKSAQAQALR